MEGKTNFLTMFSDEEERRLLLRLAGGAQAGARGGHRADLPPLHQGDFQRPAHRLIWKALVALAYQGLEISPRAVAARLGGSEALAEALHILGFGG